MENFTIGIWVVAAMMVLAGVWRPFKAAALLMEAKARYWNALAAAEEKKGTKST